MKTLPLALAALLVLPAAAPATAAVAPDAPQVQRSQRAPLRIPDAGRFRDWDSNNDGIISRAEWQGTAQEFRDLDWNRDGMLSGDEVRETVNRDYDARDGNRFAELDRNGDGQISRAEWPYEMDMFKRFDRNNDNVLSRAELGNDVSRSRYDDPEPTIDQDFDWLDRDNDNRIERNEWTGTAAEFYRLDRNRDGVLTRAEMNVYRDAVRSGAYDTFYEIDRNGNGVIARNEWHGSRASFEEYDLNNDGVITRNEYERVERGAVNSRYDDRSNNGAAARVFMVDSREQWTDTGIYVEAGDVIKYQADGTIQMSTNARDLATPAGSTTGRNAKNSPRPDRSAGGLVVRIGDASPGFLGASGTFTAQTSGQLYLGVNDDYLGDNSGSYRVSISVQSSRYRQ